MTAQFPNRSLPLLVTLTMIYEMSVTIEKPTK
jgi:hypothetical protein